jgi:glyoxylase-like metal-dependent hydrolase (beta-lactamase superfamily II)
MTGSQYPWRADPRWQGLVATARANKRGPGFFAYQSAHDPWLTSSYYFETDRGVVLFDTQLFLASAEELWQDIQQHTSGKLFAIVITHAHPDHFYGTSLFRERAPAALVITSENVDADMRRTAAGRHALVAREWPEDIPGSVDELVFADLTFPGNLTLRFSDLTIELSEHGPAEAHVQIVGWIPEHKTLVAGDIVSNKQHLYVSEGGISSWYRILCALEQLDPAHVLSGHQGAATADLLTETKVVLATMLGLSAQELGPSHDPEDFSALSAEARACIRQRLLDRFPDWYDAIMLHDDETILQYALQGLSSDGEGDDLLTGVTRFGAGGAPR